MTRLKLSEVIPSLLITLLLLIFMEVLSSAVLPLFGITNYRLPFNILIILYLGFKLDSPLVAVIILCIQFVHAQFSVEGWAMGTFAGVFVCMIINYLKELIHFSTITVTIAVTQIFQLAWFVIVAGMIYLQTDNVSYIIQKFWRFLPESITISIIAPFVFLLLDRIWKPKARGLLGEEG